MSSLFIARSPDTAARNLDGEMIIMSVKTSTLFTLNEVATAIWEAADGQTTVNQIVDQIVCRDYAVDKETAFEDAMQLVQKLVDHGIMYTSNVPIISQARQEPA